ncbi:MAG: hypothetical protein Q7J44_17615 [Pseudotabrizicola sp.]|uniref:hypothetical protein n=1 Tax=Pseudotabrizicola sp. TaxID=2939647 RepID=UPI00271C7C39|nr:hypothetical protein [Pseudotabrizicola sp.]MDO9640355.1 hypothetical protein [Pseudotabrizicola sp.]
MNSASKILTVSYGTFSCTLEGFDDPFNTMKAIAEYFRDLAAGDRYFGAEPPQPDAAMLHKIAEREIQRRVEAKVQENGVILRAEEAGTVAAHAPAPETAEVPQPVVTMPARGTAPAPRPAPTLADADTAPQPATESVAEKLSRLRKAAAEHHPAAPAPTTLTLAPGLDDFTEDQHAGAPLPASALFDADDAGLTTDSSAFDDILPEDTPAADAQILAGDLPPEDQSVAADDLKDEAPQDLRAEAPVADSADDWVDDADLADLMALDGVAADLADPEGSGDDLSDPDAFAASDDTPVAEDTADADRFDQDMLASLNADAADAAPDLMAGASSIAGDTARMAEDDMAEDGADDALLASLGTLVAAQEAGAGAMPDADAQDSADDAVTGFDGADDFYDDEAEEPEAQAAAEFAPEFEDAFEDDASEDDASEDDADAALLQPLSDATVQTLPETLTVEAPEADTDDHAPQPEAEAEADTIAAPVRPLRPVRTLRPAGAERPAAPDLASEPEPEAQAESRTPISVEKLQRARARVIKIRRSDAPDAGASAPARATLSREAEAALAAELAALEQDAPDQTAARTSDGMAGHRLDRPTEEVAVSRLMAEASTQMEVPDTKRRRSAIAHLKAAVAATIAERRATGSTLAENGRARMGAYRDDLAKVMRPTSAPLAPQAERPAPLVLVSEQRIDRPAEVSRAPVAAVQPVRPRRPMSSAAVAIEAALDDGYDADEETGNIFDTDSGFPEFAEQLGATDLPDLLEAAAAYIACVEGLDSFTRPQLMRHLGAATEGVSREDGLRSFGILLREGVIERSRRGQFAISDASPLLAQARKIAG